MVHTAHHGGCTQNRWNPGYQAPVLGACHGTPEVAEEQITWKLEVGGETQLMAAMCGSRETAETLRVDGVFIRRRAQLASNQGPRAMPCAHQAVR